MEATIGDIRLLQGDCLELMPSIADGSVNLVLADLPYGILNKGNAHTGWDRELPLDVLWTEWKRLLKPNGAVVLFGQGLFSAKLMMSQPKMYRYSLVWNKVLKTGFLNAKRMPLRQHEDILVFYRQKPVYNPQMTKCEPHNRNHPRGGQSKGVAPVNKCYGEFRNIPDVITDEKYPISILTFAKEHKNGEFYHPTLKPVALLEWIVKTYTNEGGVVLDNVMGSGSAMVACVNTGRRGIGIELMQEYYDVAVGRVTKAVAHKVEQQIKQQ